MSQFFKRKQAQTESKPAPIVHEVSRGFLSKLTEKAKSIIRTTNDSTKPDRLSHPNYMDRYVDLCSDPTVSVSLDIKKNAIVPDFYFEMPEEPEGEKTHKIEAKIVGDDPQTEPTSKAVEKPKPKKKHPNQLKLEEWKKNTKAVKKLKQIVGTMLAKGFCPVEVEDDYSLKILPPENFYIYRDKYGTVLKYTQEQTVGNPIVEWKTSAEMDKIILFINDEDTDHPYGEADVESLVTLLDTRSSLNEDMGKIIHRFSAPFITLRASGSAADIKTNMEAKDVDEILYLGKTNKDEVELIVVEPDPQVKFLPYIDSVDFQIGQKLNAPTMLLLKNATEASATKMLDAFNVWVQSFQNELLEVLEERIYKKIIASGPVPIMRFGAPREVLDEITLPDINNCTDKTISKRQAQDLLKKKGIELIEDEEFLNRQHEPSPFDNPFGDKGKQPFTQKKPFTPQPATTQPSTERFIEKLGDMELGLTIITASYCEGKLKIAEACQQADKTISAHMQLVHKEEWKDYRDKRFRQFLYELVPDLNRLQKQETYTVKVEG
jgi:hypothetical protein